MLQSVSVSFSHSIRAWMDGGCLICESAAKSNIVNIGRFGTVIDLMPSLLVHHSTLEGSICQSLSVSLQHPSEQLFSEHSLAFNRIEMQLVEFANGIAAVRCHSSSSNRNYGSSPLFSTAWMTLCASFGSTYSPLCRVSSVDLFDVVMRNVAKHLKKHQDLYRDALKGGPRLCEDYVKILCFPSCKRATKHNFFTQFHTTWGPPFRASL